jgi:hypothetical protein
VIVAETFCHLFTIKKINIHNTSCVLSSKSLLLTCKHNILSPTFYAIEGQDGCFSITSWLLLKKCTIRSDVSENLFVFRTPPTTDGKVSGLWQTLNTTIKPDREQ